MGAFAEQKKEKSSSLNQVYGKNAHEPEYDQKVQAIFEKITEFSKDKKIDAKEGAVLIGLISDYEKSGAQCRDKAIWLSEIVDTIETYAPNSPVLAKAQQAFNGQVNYLINYEKNISDAQKLDALMSLNSNAVELDEKLKQTVLGAINVYVERINLQLKKANEKAKLVATAAYFATQYQIESFDGMKIWRFLGTSIEYNPVDKKNTALEQYWDENKKGQKLEEKDIPANIAQCAIEYYTGVKALANEMKKQTSNTDVLTYLNALISNADEWIKDAQKMKKEGRSKSEIVYELINFEQEYFRPAMQKVENEQFFDRLYTAAGNNLTDKFKVWIKKDGKSALTWLTIGASVIFAQPELFGVLGAYEVSEGIPKLNFQQAISGGAFIGCVAAVPVVSVLSGAYIYSNICNDLVRQIQDLKKGIGSAERESFANDLFIGGGMAIGMHTAYNEMKIRGKEKNLTKQAKDTWKRQSNETPVESKLNYDGKEPKVAEKMPKNGKDGAKTDRNGNVTVKIKKADIIRNEILDNIGVDIDKLSENARKDVEKAFAYEKNGKFKKAAKRYKNAITQTSEIKLNDEQIVKLSCKMGENCEKANLFGEAGWAYCNAAAYTQDVEQSARFYGKAGENYEKGEIFEFAGWAYKNAVIFDTDMTNQLYYAKKSSENYKKHEDYDKVDDAYYEIRNEFERLGIRFILIDFVADLKFLRNPENASQIAQMAEILKKHDSGFKEAFNHNIEINKTRDFEGTVRYLQLMDEYYNVLGQSYFGLKVITENPNLSYLDANVSRLSFKKTGSMLIPLGGKLTGYMFRIIKKENFDVWKKADEVLTNAGMPDRVEPILKVYDRVNYQEQGMVSVVTKYCGERSSEVLENPKKYAKMYNMPEYELINSVTSQVNAIMATLEDGKIEHGHTHRGNFVVDIKDGKPFVRIIDWDQAVSTQ